uniref:Integrase catalytic domain-containing protein n=1 Tax=Fagus sylvatica TaxID=28930 RepID=A0A2N9HL41_FAGSY
MALKEQVEMLIRQDKLQKYVGHPPNTRPPKAQRPKEWTENPKPGPVGEIRTIVGGPAARGISRTSRKAYARQGSSTGRFIAEFTTKDDEPKEEEEQVSKWTAHIDGSSTKNAGEIGIIFYYAIRRRTQGCLAPTEAEYVLKEMHEGICRNHSGARSLSNKIIRAGYYWPSIQMDTNSFVQRCDKCQRFANLLHSPPEELTSMTTPWPFAQWGLDIMGPFPIGRRQLKLLVVAIDYFTKWVEAEPLATITERNIQNFVWKAVIYQFGIP